MAEPIDPRRHTSVLESEKFGTNANNRVVVRVEDESGLKGILGGISFDAVSVSYPNATTEVYTFKEGGLSGSTVSVVTLIFTNASKEDLLSAERT